MKNTTEVSCPLSHSPSTVETRFPSDPTSGFSVSLLLVPPSSSLFYTRAESETFKLILGLNQVRVFLHFDFTTFAFLPASVSMAWVSVPLTVLIPSSDVIVSMNIPSLTLSLVFVWGRFLLVIMYFPFEYCRVE